MEGVGSRCCNIVHCVTQEVRIKEFDNILCLMRVIIDVHTCIVLDDVRIIILYTGKVSMTTSKGFKMLLSSFGSLWLPSSRTINMFWDTSY